MPSKKKKYNARFPAGRIKKIMQTDEEVGKVAQAVPVIISRTLELFVQSLLSKSMQVTKARSAKTLTPSHMKQCIFAESRFDFLRDLVKDVPDPSTQEDNENNAMDIDFMQNKLNDQASPLSFESGHTGNVMRTFCLEQGTSFGRTPVIQFGPNVAQIEQSTPSIESLTEKVKQTEITEQNYQLDFSQIATGNLVSQAVPTIYPDQVATNVVYTHVQTFQDANVPPLIPISHTNVFGQGTGDNLYIDEDYDN